MDLKIAIAQCGFEPDNYINALKGAAKQLERTVEIDIFTPDMNPADYDGLLLPGGSDIDPAYYGQQIDGCGTIEADIDKAQFAVLDLFVKAQKPVLGICKGHQLINVYFGGTLIQDLKNSADHRQIDGVDNKNLCSVEEGSWISSIYGWEPICVNSAHHQAVDRVGSFLRTVMCSEDGVNEALEHQELPVYSTQWHPERMCFAKRREDTVDGSSVFRFFLKKCINRKLL